MNIYPKSMYIHTNLTGLAFMPKKYICLWIYVDFVCGGLEKSHEIYETFLETNSPESVCPG